MTREEKLIADIKTLIDAEDCVHEHVLLYTGIKELLEKYEEEMNEQIERTISVKRTGE